MRPRQPFEQTDVVLQNLLIIENHRRKVGRCAWPHPLTIKHALPGAWTDSDAGLRH